MKKKGNTGNAGRGFWKRAVAALLALTLCLSGGALPLREAQAASKRWNKVDGVCYNGKGKAIPRAITRGIDVSAWQGKIDWEKVKTAGVDFAFIRAGHGTHDLDTQFRNNMNGAIKAGIPVGVYFYSTATSTAQSLKDAQWVIQSIQGYKISYPVVVDMESSNQLGLSNTQRTNIAKVFLEEVQRAGYYPMLYCNTYWYNNYLNVSALSGYDKWLANYGDALTAPTGVPNSAYTIWQATSGSTESGLSSTRGLIPGIPVENDVDVDFGYRDYTQVITPRTYAKDSYTSGSRWIQDSKGWRYQLSDGTYLKNTARTIDGKKYYFKSDTYMATDWLLLNGNYYYMGSDGAMRKNWQLIGGKWYYFGSSGIMRKGLIKVSGDYYLLNSSGAMLTGWQKYKNRWMYFGSSGAAKKGWADIGGKRYCFRQNGTMITGLVRMGGKKFYFNKDGVLSVGWFKYTNGKWYYSNQNGVVQTGWIRVGGKWYYLNAVGTMQTGWVSDGGQWYYLTADGSMKVGWLKYKGDYYYLLGDGRMARNTTLTIDGKKYTFNAKGVRVK